MREGVFNAKDVPDHLLEEIKSAYDELCPILSQFYIKHGPQAANAAFGRVHFDILFTIMKKEGLVQTLETQANYYLTLAEMVKEREL